MRVLAFLFVWFVCGAIGAELPVSGKHVGYLPDNEPKYDVWLTEGHGSSGSPIATNQLLEEEHVIYKVGAESYACAFPAVEDEEESASEASADGQPSNLHPNDDRRLSPRQLLARLGGNQPCLYHVESWWTYEYCWADGMHQFHAEMNPEFPNDPTKAIRVAEFTLGTVLDKDLMTENRADGYVGQLLVHGTPCDLKNGRPRTSEVRFYCDENPMGMSFISSVSEPSTCHYLIKINTPHLCHHDAYKPTPTLDKRILCSKL